MSKTLISILGGLAGMFGWGVSDFFANNASDRIGHTKTLFWSQLAGLALMGATAILFVSDFILTGKLLFLMIMGGVVYTVGYLLFYKAFEIGNVSVVSAVVGSQNIFVILVSYFLFKQQLTTLQIPALAMILIGVTLVSVDFKELFKKNSEVSLVKGVKEALMAAFLFGAFFWPINEYNTEQADWIMVSFITKTVAILAILAVAFMQKKNLKINKPTKNLKNVILTIGLLEALAVLGVSFGTSLGDAIIVAPISSGLTVVTVALAIIFLKEKITKTQGFGILLTILGIVLTGF